MVKLSCTFFNGKRPIHRRVIDCLFKFVISLFIGRRSLVWLLMRVSLLLVSIQVNATDVDKVYRFDIPAQSLVESLGDISQTTKRLFLFPYDLVETKESKHLSGLFTAQQALDLLLAGTGLQGELSDNKTFVVKPILAPKKNVQTGMKGEKELKTQKTILASLFTIIFSSASSAEEIKKQFIDNKAEEIEVITVSGVRGSLKKSMNDKRFSSEIMDSISAEDIGQLPDENIAEALQRVTGIQMTRGANGEGTTVQIRGLSDNNVEINGQTAAGTSADRSVNFADIPSELFSGIEVLKAPTADRIEGSLGGTVNLKTRRPLNIEEDYVATVTAKAKYAEISGETTPNLNVFLGKNWRDTAIGDFGLIVNGGRQETISQTDAFGGGDYDDAPGSWYRINGNKNAAAPFNKGPWVSDANIDLNGDGASDNKDIYYVPNGLRTYSRYDEVVKDSLNVTLHWQPNEDLELFLDYTKTDSEEDSAGSQLNIATNGGRAVPILLGDAQFDSIGHRAGLLDSDGIFDTSLAGENYYLASGLLGGVNIRTGGAPSQKSTWREADKISFGGEYIVTDNLTVSAEISTSKGTSTTKQAQLNMGYDWDNNSQLNGKDWAGIVEYDWNSADLVDYTLYEAPFYAGTGPITPDELVAIDPTDMTYDRLNYFQMQRNADDTESNNDSFKFDIDYEFNDGFITKIKAGARYAKRSFERSSYINSNQKNTIVGDDGVYEKIDIQDIKVHPDANSSPELAQVATDLQQCFGTTSMSLDGVSGNFPRAWSNTNACGSDFFTRYFNMHDIRAFNPAKGAGYYENTGMRYDVEEETTALYIKADYFTEIGGMSLFGNFGVRYVETKTTSGGYLTSAPGAVSTFEWIEFEGDYSDFLPSLNANLALNDEMVLRFAAYKALQRPGLGAIAPSVKIKYNDELEGYAGAGSMGNPDLDPIHATNLDLSYEWYYADDSMFSVAAFYKDIDTTIGKEWENPQDVSINDELFLVNQDANLPGTKINGVEVAIQHGFSNLPGLLANTGIGANYTYTQEDSELIDQEGDEVRRKGLSEHSYNLSAFYDDGPLSIRLAYNWRDDFVKRNSVTLGWGSSNTLPEIEAARGQLDLTANYKLTKNLKINFAAVNLNDSETKRYLKYEPLHSYLAKAGVRYNLAAVYRF